MPVQVTESVDTVPNYVGRQVVIADPPLQETVRKLLRKSTLSNPFRALHDEDALHASFGCGWSVHYGILRQSGIESLPPTGRGNFRCQPTFRLGDLKFRT